MLPERPAPRRGGRTVWAGCRPTAAGVPFVRVQSRAGVFGQALPAVLPLAFVFCDAPVSADRGAAQPLPGGAAMRRAGVAAVLAAVLVCLRAMQRQSGWLFWASVPNALVLAWTLLPHALALALLRGTYRAADRTGRRRAAAAATGVAAGVLALTLFLYAGPLVDAAGLMSGPAFVLLPGYVLALGVPALAALRWWAGRAQRP